jgi:ABC-2 type transport system ATP-binding protein
MKTALSWEKVEKSFRGRPAVRGISLAVQPGEIFGLLGHNGAGKSTCFGMALGQVRADSGRVLIDGFDPAENRFQALSRVGAIFETPSFYDYLSGWRNLQMLVALSARPDPAQLREVVELVGLSTRIHDPVRAYSHGMRQRLALAQALLPNPALLLLDEPTEGLDPTGIHEIRTLLLRLREERGLTIILSSHLLAEVEKLCDRVAILHQGELLFCGAWQENTGMRWLLDTPDLTAALTCLTQAHWESLGDGFIRPKMDALPPEELVATLVAAGVRVREFRRQPFTLEDFYLQKIR